LGLTDEVGEPHAPERATPAAQNEWTFNNKLLQYLNMAKRKKYNESSELLAGVEHMASMPLYNAFLFDSNSPLPLRAAQTPRQVLEKMCQQTFIADTDAGSIEVTAMEAMLANMVSAGLQGNLGIVKDIYQELEHNGIQKIQVMHQKLSTGTLNVLKHAGVDIENMIDITPKLPNLANEQETVVIGNQINPEPQEQPSTFDFLSE
jgi:hypothetical protein